jgi:hypothetical protein
MDHTTESLLHQLAASGAQTKADILGWFPDDPGGAQRAFNLGIEFGAIVQISGNGPDDPHARWAVSAEVLLRYMAQESARSN